MILAGLDPLANLLFWNVGDKHVNEGLDVFLVDKLADLAEVWNLWALFIDKLPKSWDGEFLDFGLNPLDEVFAKGACDFVVFFEEWDTWLDEVFIAIVANLDEVADSGDRDGITKPVNDRWEEVGNDGAADEVVWEWDLEAKGRDKVSNLILGSLVVKKLLDVFDNFSAVVAGAVVFFFGNTDLDLAKLEFGADVEGGELLVEPVDDEWDVLGSDASADGAVWLWELFAKLGSELDNFTLGGGGLDKSFNILDNLVADFAAERVFISEIMKSLGGGAKTKLGADVERGDLGFEPLHDGWDVLSNKSAADGTIWFWNLVAKFAGKFDDSGLGSFGFHKLLNIINKTLACFTAKAVVFWNVTEKICGLAKANLGANVKSGEFVFEPLHDGWDVLRNKSFAKGVVWRWKLLANLARKLGDLFNGSFGFHKLADVINKSGAGFTAEIVGDFNALEGGAAEVDDTADD